MTAPPFSVFMLFPRNRGATIGPRSLLMTEALEFWELTRGKKIKKFLLQNELVNPHCCWPEWMNFPCYF
jgi:hypothetical protein